MSVSDLLAVLHLTGDDVVAALAEEPRRGLVEGSTTQHHSDVAADAAALERLVSAGFGVLSEESGLRLGRPGAPVVVVDPLDGSTNAAHGLPWYATSLCAVDEAGPAAAVVVDLVSGTRYEAVRGGGARRDGVTIGPSGCRVLGEAIVGLSDLPPHHLGWRQYRALGALALDLCAVADGRLDGYLDCGADAHGPWDYLGGLLVCREAGVEVVDALGRDLVVLEHRSRRTPIAASTSDLLAELLVARDW